MIKDYYLEAKFHAERWTLIQTYKKMGDALAAIAERDGSERYPVRIIRVVRTIVFEEQNAKRTNTRTKTTLRDKVAKVSRGDSEVSTVRRKKVSRKTKGLT